MIKQLSIGKGLLKIVALTFIMFICFYSTKVFASSELIQNDTFWKDTDGNTIYSQGGGILKVDDTYYWYGVKYDEAVTYAGDTSKYFASNTTFNSITCYSSNDLVNWKSEGEIITKEDFSDTPQWVGRCGVFYNKSTSKYVLVSQYKNSDGSLNGELFATCDTPNGKFTYSNVQSPVSGIVNTHTGDQSIFTDDDGKSYLICSCASGRAYLYVAPFSDDGLSVGTPTQIAKTSGREGNCMFKYNGYYYFCSSDLHGWNSSHCYYMKSENILGPYESEQVMENTDSDFCHVSQTGFFTNVTGTEGTTVLFCGDRWSDFAGNGLGYNEWCPISFDGTTPIFNSVSQFNLDAEKGTWSAGSKNNYILNPSFEADRVLQTSLAGWTHVFNTSDTTSRNINLKKQVSYGNFALQHWYSKDYTATTYQDITDIPNGTYTLKAWVKSGGGQETCNIFVKDFGGEEKDYAINNAISSFTEITISDINVTNGKCQVGVYSDASANQYCQVDNFSLIQD